MKKDATPRRRITDGGSGVEAAGAGLPRNGRAAQHQALPKALGRAAQTATRDDGRRGEAPPTRPQIRAFGIEP